jgi:WD40 repeat protein
MGMQATAIRQLATSWRGSIIAAGEFERTIHLYDLSTQERIRTIDTTLDFGGRRLAISNTGRTIIVGAYRRHGIAAYSGESGGELWRRKDLKKVQHIEFNGDASRVLCCFDSAPCESLNAETGKSGRTLREVRGAWESPYTAVRFIARTRDYAIADPEGPLASIPRVSFGVLSVAFSGSLVCVSEAGGPVRALDLSSGAERWRHTPKGTHFLRVAYVDSAGAFVGVSWPFERGGAMLLQRFEPDGRAVVIAEIVQTAVMEFASKGEHLVTSAGIVYESLRGGRVDSLPFPPAQTRGGAP